MIVFDVALGGTMHRVAAIGSCRITTPIDRLCSKGVVSPVWLDTIMAHTTADVRQNLDVVRLALDPPAFFEPLIHQPGKFIKPPPEGAEIMESIDTFLVEVCENALLQVGPWSVLVTRIGDTILSEHAELLLPWWNEVCVFGRATDEMLAQVMAGFGDKPAPDELALLLRNMVRTPQDERALSDAMASLMRAYPGRWIFVSHFAVPGVDSTLMNQRRALSRQLEQAAKLVGAEFFDPSTSLARVGRKRALAANGADVYHYSTEFEEILGKKLLGLLKKGAKARQTKPLARIAEVHERVVELIRRSDVVESRLASELSSLRQTVDANRQDLVERAAHRLETQMADVRRTLTLLHADLATRDARITTLMEDSADRAKRELAALDAFGAERVRMQTQHTEALLGAEGRVEQFRAAFEGERARIERTKEEALAVADAKLEQAQAVAEQARAVFEAQRAEMERTQAEALAIADVKLEQARTVFEAQRAELERTKTEALAAADAKLEQALLTADARLEQARADAEALARAQQSEFTASLADLGERLESIQSAATAAQATLKREHEERIAALMAEWTAAEAALSRDHHDRVVALAEARAAAEEALRRSYEAHTGEQAAELERRQAALDHALAERQIILGSTAWRATALLRRGLTALLGRSRPPEG